MAKTAFIVLKSPVELDPTHLMKRLADRKDSTVLLLEDGVYQAVQLSAASRLEKVASDILVSDEDLEARGFGTSDLKLGKAVGYPEIVECIMERTDRTITI